MASVGRGWKALICFWVLAATRSAGRFNPIRIPEVRHPTEQCHFKAPPHVLQHGKQQKGGLFMTEEEKMQVAVFRFGVISDFVNGSKLASGEKTRLIREKCARKWQIPFSEKTRIGRSTILRWVRLYNKSGGKLDSLRPSSRKDCNKSRAMDEDTCLGLMSLRNLMPE